MPACPGLCLQLVLCPLPACEQADGGAIVISPIEGAGRGLFQIPSCLSCWNSLPFADVDQQPEGKNSCFKLSRRQEAKRGSVLYGERKERKEKYSVVGDFKGNSKVGKRQDRRLRRMDAWAPSCTVLRIKGGLAHLVFTVVASSLMYIKLQLHLSDSLRKMSTLPYQACQSCG